MKLLQAKLAKYDAPQKAKAAGVYPYFRKIESEQDTEVLINGKKVLMFGSNSYLGLTNHPKVIEAAVAATKNMAPDVQVRDSSMARSIYMSHWKTDLQNSSGKKKQSSIRQAFK